MPKRGYRKGFSDSKKAKRDKLRRQAKLGVVPKLPKVYKKPVLKNLASRQKIENSCKSCDEIQTDKNSLSPHVNNIEVYQMINGKSVLIKNGEKPYSSEMKM